MNVTDIGSIPISSEVYIKKSNNLTQEQVDDTMFPEVLSPLQHEFKYLYDELPRLHPKYMFIPAKPGVLPSKFLDLKYYVPLYSSTS